MYKGYKIYTVLDENDEIKYSTDDFKLFDDIGELEKHIDFILGEEYNIEDYYNILYNLDDYDLFDLRLNNEYIKNKLKEENLDSLKVIFSKDNMLEIRLEFTNLRFCDTTEVKGKKIDYEEYMYNNKFYYILLTEEWDILGYVFDDFFGIRKDLKEYINILIEKQEIKNE